MSCGCRVAHSIALCLAIEGRLDIERLMLLVNPESGYGESNSSPDAADYTAGSDGFVGNACGIR
jgi:hypothetical protein